MRPVRPWPARRARRAVSPRRTGAVSLAVGGVLAGAVVATALLSLVWTPYPPEAVDTGGALLPPGGEHPLGTDRFGRDVLSRVMAGARVTLQAGVSAVVIAAAVGVPLGVAAAMAPRWLSRLVLRANDLVLAFPALLLCIMLSAVYGGSTLTAMAAIGIATVPLFARLARAAALPVLASEYAAAARAAGRGRVAVAVRHVLPNIADVLIVQASVAFAIAILAEAALSYLGLGTQPPTPSWGRMLQEAQGLLSSAPLLSLWPGLAVAVAVLGFNMVGEGLRDLLDAGGAREG